MPSIKESLAVNPFPVQEKVSAVSVSVVFSVTACVSDDSEAAVVSPSVISESLPPEAVSGSCTAVSSCVPVAAWVCSGAWVSGDAAVSEADVSAGAAVSVGAAAAVSAGAAAGVSMEADVSAAVVSPVVVSA